MSRKNIYAHHRKSIRLKNYDYAKENLYYITICTQNRECILSKIENNINELTSFGQIVKQICEETIRKYNMKLLNYVIMPNHIHAIIEIYKTNDKQCKSGTISDIIREIKSITTLEYIKGVNNNILPSFNKRIWQRNYYEHIIRNENEYNIIYMYINNNILNWQNDKYTL